MRTHPQVAGVQEFGCGALFNVCAGGDEEEALARSGRQAGRQRGARWRLWPFTGPWETGVACQPWDGGAWDFLGLWTGARKKHFALLERELNLCALGLVFARAPTLRARDRVETLNWVDMSRCVGVQHGDQDNVCVW
jgi:hypothetical protein